MIIPLLITSTFLPVKKAEAALPLVLPVGGAVAAGVYVTTALAVGGLATVVGLEYGDEINAHANRVWDGTTQAVNDSINWSMQQWQTAQDGIMPIGSALSSYLESQIPGLVADILTEYYQENGMTISTQPSFNHVGDMTGPLAGLNGNWGSSDYKAYFVTNGSASWYGNSRTIYIGRYSGSISLCAGYDCANTPIKAGVNADVARGALLNVKSLHALQAWFNLYAASMTVDIRGGDSTFTEQYNQGVSSTREAWQDMKDAGLVLPNTGVITHTADTLVNYNAQTDTWQGVDGNVYNPSDLTWRFPTIRTRTGTADIPAGTYVDSPTLTGNPAIDTPITSNPAIPRTTTNIETGVTYADPEAPTVPTNPTTPDKPSYNIFKVLLDLLKAIINLLKSYWLFFLLLPTIPEQKIPFEMFQAFKTFKPFGFPIYATVQALALFTATFLLLRVLRRMS